MEGLGPFDQLPCLRTYSQMLLCFPLAEGVLLEEVVACLERSLSAMTTSFPFLGCQVVISRDVAHTCSGTFKIVPYKEACTMRIEELAEDFQSYDQISKAKAPFSMLNGKVLAPMKSLPYHYEASTVTPVLVVQANFTIGGLLLCFAGMHNAMDGNGLAQIVKLFATACRGESFPEAAVYYGNCDRNQLIPSLGVDEIPQDHSDYRRMPGHYSGLQLKKHVSATWSYFRLPKSMLDELKATALQECSEHASNTWVSTNDIACALIWRSISTARLPQLNLDDDTLLSRAVNGRQRLRPALPDEFLGNIVAGASTTMSLSQLTQDLSLYNIACRIRQSLNKIDDFHIRSLATLIRSETDKSTIAFELPNPERDVTISSWASLPIYSCDFGPLLKRPEYVRRPAFEPSDGLVYIMPKTLEGHLDIAISLRNDDMKRLKEDEAWKSFAQFIG